MNQRSRKLYSCLHLRRRCINTRMRADGNRIRRYECEDCGNRFSTLEVPVGRELVSGRKAQTVLEEDMRARIEAKCKASLLRALDIHGPETLAEIFKEAENA